MTQPPLKPQTHATFHSGSIEFPGVAGKRRSSILLLGWLVAGCGTTGDSAQVAHTSGDNDSGTVVGDWGPDADSSSSTDASSGDGGVPPSTSNGTYKVYGGCELPTTTFKREVYVDAASGVDVAGRGTAGSPYKSLSFLLANKSVQAGDHIIVQGGQYGALNIRPNNAPTLASSTDWTWFDFRGGAELSSVALAQISHVLVTGATIMNTSGDMLSLSGTTQVVATGNTLRSASVDPNTLSVQQWMGLASAVDVRNGSCNSIYKNQIRNVRFGISMASDAKTYPQNSMKGLVEENDLVGFSADASRGIGSDLAFLKNRFVDGYVSIADGDANHDDMFQGFALQGAVFENVLVEGNYMVDRTTAGRSLTSDYQGISVFDGLYRNVTVRRNIVATGAYHGIAMYGLDGVMIENNTIASTSGKTLWVGIFPSKQGVAPINNVVRNNLAREFSGMMLTSSNTNNFVIADPSSSYVAFDLTTGTFDFRLKPSDSAYGKGAGAL